MGAISESANLGGVKMVDGDYQEVRFGKGHWWPWQEQVYAGLVSDTTWSALRSREQRRVNMNNSLKREMP